MSYRVEPWQQCIQRILKLMYVISQYQIKSYLFSLQIHNMFICVAMWVIEKKISPSFNNSHIHDKERWWLARFMPVSMLSVFAVQTISYWNGISGL